MKTLLRITKWILIIDAIALILFIDVALIRMVVDGILHGFSTGASQNDIGFGIVMVITVIGLYAGEIFGILKLYENYKK